MRYILLYLLFFLLSTTTFAQNKLTGSIKDKQSGAPVQGASVYFPDLKIGAISDIHGKYVLNNIPKGYYLIEVSSIGYRSAINLVTIKVMTTADLLLGSSA